MELNHQLSQNLYQTLRRFIAWLDRYGEVSQDQYDFWATGYGRLAKSMFYRHSLIGTVLVSPLVFLDSFFPASRALFRKPSRFPIADAHYAMGFAFLYQATGEERYYHRALHFLDKLMESRCPEYKNYAWGYPFHWMTVSGLIPSGTPLITTTPYVYEAFHTVYQLDKDDRWKEILQSIVRHVADDYHDKPENSDVTACSYIARDKLKNVNYIPVINANAYRAHLLLHAANLFDNRHYRESGERNLNYILENQQPDGSWFYAVGEVDQFVDHFHTCFVLKNLIKSVQLTGRREWQAAIDRGLAFYTAHLFDSHHLPLPFARKQRLIPYRRELYDYAECINLAVLLESSGYPDIQFHLQPLRDLLSHWQKPDGSFRTRKLWVGWNNVPYHRWAQSQLFRSLSLLYLQIQKNLR